MRTALALILLASPAAAQDWPPEVAAIVDEAKAICSGTFTAAPDAVTQVDLTGDGTPDWVVDSAAFQCSDTYGTYCGTAGCAVDTVVDGIRTSFLFHDWGTETDGRNTYLTAPNVRGVTSRFLWGNGEWQLQ
ncbi:MAG TPA: hypothetical protein VK146_08475 [Tabrizicola sp.]|nr:hypothetical protein [Tabrizicola sp.]